MVTTMVSTMVSIMVSIMVSTQWCLGSLSYVFSEVMVP